MRGADESATWAEIMRQPVIWRRWAGPLAGRAADLRDWIASHDEIWLSGAGTSAYVGEIAAWGERRLVPAPTTDVVACPQDWLGREGRILSVQFGRSGDSSESVGMLDLLDAHRPDISRLSITCNGEGALAARMTGADARAIVLPEATHDAGFAMTSSFTTMLLTALACLGAIEVRVLRDLADRAETILSDLEARVIPRPDRAVFLGSGALRGAARESALKVLELTAGRTATGWDSALGFRHGPKSFVGEDTCVFVSVHPHPHTARYDRAIAAEVAAQFPGASLVTMGEGCEIEIGTCGEPRADAVLHVLAAQVLAARWSAELGLDVDDPFEGRALTRVVSGVALHPFAA